MGERYAQVYNDQWWDYVGPTDIACCDCGLVHTMKIRRRGSKVQVCMDRRPGLTAKLRKKGRFPCQPKT